MGHLDCCGAAGWGAALSDADLKEFKVRVVASAYIDYTFLAETQQEAEQKALDNAYDCPFPDEFGAWEVVW